MIASIAGYFLYGGIITGSINFEPKHTGEPNVVLYDIDVNNAVTSVTINWVAGGVKILPTTGSQIRIVEKAYEPIDHSKWATVSTDNGNLLITSKNKPLFNFLGLLTKSTYLEVYLPITGSYSLVKLTGVSGAYSVNELYAEMTQITLTSGSLNYTDSYSTLLSLNMTSGSATISSSTILSSSIRMTSGQLDYHADTLNFSATMTSGQSSITFGSTNPASFYLAMTSGQSTINLNGTESFSVKVDKTSGVFDPQFAYVKNDKIYSYQSGGPQYGIQMTSGSVDFILSAH